MHKTHINICLCTFKRPKLLANLLNRLEILQTNNLFTYSVIIVDNDKNKTAKEIVESKQKNSNITFCYYVDPRQNIAHARNTSVKNADGNFIAFIDDDEIPNKNWLLYLFTTLIKYNADGVFGSVIPQFKKLPPNWIVKSELFFWRDRHDKTGTVMSSGSTGNTLIKSDIISRLDPVFNPAFGLSGGEDAELFRKLFKQGNVFVSCKEAIVYEYIPPYRMQPNYLLKRNFLEGMNAMRIFSHLENKLYCIFWFFKSIIAIISYSLCFFVLLLGGKRYYMKYALKIYYFIGMILRYLNINIMINRKNL